MKLWQLDALEHLMAIETKQVEQDLVYIRSKEYDDTACYHLLHRRSDDSVQIEEIPEENRSSRVTFQDDEIAKLLRTLLEWYLESVEPDEDRQPEDDFFDSIGVHPF